MDKAMIKTYTETFGCRYTKAQKNKFLQELKKDMKELGYEAEEIKGKKLVSRARSYLFGNVKQIKTLIVVAYDTPEKKFWKDVVYYPMDGTRTASKTMLATYVPVLVLFALVFAGVYVIQPMLTSFAAATAMSIFMFAMTIGLVYLMLHGVHNRKNYNRNSAAVITALNIAAQLNKDERKKVGFLFTDKNKNHFLGAESSMQFLNEKGKNPNIICLDCIANGSYVRVGYNPQNRKLAADMVKYNPDKNVAIECVKLHDDMRLQSAMSFYKKAMIVSCGELDQEQNLYVMGTGTGKDTVIDETWMQLIGDMIVRYLHAQK